MAIDEKRKLKMLDGDVATLVVAQFGKSLMW